MVESMEKIVNLCKNRGIIYAGSEIYGGLANTWDYGPLGSELKNNVKAAWKKKFIQESKYNVGLDAAILMNPQTWVASGHLGGFSDPLMDCKACKERFRADKLIEDYMEANGITEEQFSVILVNVIDDDDVQKEIGCGKYDMVCANILAEVLVPLTPVIASRMKKGGVYITSGIIEDKEDVVVNAVKAAGLELLEINYQGEWVSVTARKNQ